MILLYLTTINFVLLYCFSGITVPRRTSLVCLYNSWHLGKVWLTSIILAAILDTLVKFLTPKKGKYFSRWRSASNSETVQNPRSSQISLLEFLRRFRETITNKVSISDYLFTFVPVVQQVLFHFESCINFLHFELLPLFLVNFLYSKVVFH